VLVQVDRLRDRARDARDRLDSLGLRAFPVGRSGRNPAAWKRVPLRKLCAIQAGPSYSRLRAQLRSADGTVPVVLPKHIRHDFEQSIDPHYLLGYLSLPDVVEWIRNRSKVASVIASINAATLGEIPIAVPPLDERGEFTVQAMEGLPCRTPNRPKRESFGCWWPSCSPLSRW
jgi:hypothetical protein